MKCINCGGDGGPICQRCKNIDDNDSKFETISEMRTMLKQGQISMDEFVKIIQAVNEEE